MRWHIKLKFCIWLCFTVLQSVVKLRQFLVGVMPLLELRILEKHNFLHFSLICCGILSWKFHMTFFYCTSDQVRVSSIHINFCRSNAPFWTSAITLCPSGSQSIHPFIHFLHLTPTCIDNFSWNLKFDVGVFNALVLEKYYKYKIAFKMFMQKNYAPFAVLGYIWIYHKERYGDYK